MFLTDFFNAVCQEQNSRLPNVQILSQRISSLGLQFYFSQYSRKPIDPYKVTDAGKAFASGDSFVVYPGDNFTPLNSLRLNVFYDGLQDMMALQLLETKIGKEAVVKLMEDSTDKPITFSEYPHSNSWLLENREKINQKIKKYI